MIRRATVDDMDECARLLVQFHAYSPYAPYPVDAVALRTFLAALVEHGAVFLSDDGIIGGLLNPLYFNPAHVIAAELFWWAPKEGTALREAFEAWADERGACAISFSGIRDGHSKAIERVFRRAGYSPVETAFFKRVS